MFSINLSEIPDTGVRTHRTRPDHARNLTDTLVIRNIVFRAYYARGTNGARTRGVWVVRTFPRIIFGQFFAFSPDRSFRTPTDPFSRYQKENLYRIKNTNCPVEIAISSRTYLAEPKR